MDYYKDTRISNSGLSKINPDQGGSAKRFQEWLNNREEQKELTYLERGKLLHMSILEPELYKVAPVDKPEGKIGKIIDFMYDNELELNDADILTAANAIEYYGNRKDETRIRDIRADGEEYLAYLQEVRDNDLMPLTRSMKEIIDSCYFAVQKHPEARQLLFGGGDEAVSEEEYFTTLPALHAEQIIEVKAKIDRSYPIDDRTGRIIELKTTGFPVSQFPTSFQKFRYYRQSAFYGDILKAELGFADIIHTFIVVETKAPFEVAVFDIDQDWVDYGVMEYKRLLALYEYYKKNDWEHDQRWRMSMIGGDAVPRAMIASASVDKLIYPEQPF